MIGLKNIIQKAVQDKNICGNTTFAGIVEHISLFVFEYYFGGREVLSKIRYRWICQSVIAEIDSRKVYKSKKTIRGREYAETYKKILTEVYAEGHRITPDWLVKQYVAKGRVYLCKFIV